MSFLPAALAIAGPLISGIGGKMAGDSNARRLREAARDEDLSGLEERGRAREQIRSQIGEQLAAQVSNGLEGGSGTALDALRQSQIEGVLDVMEMRRQSQMKARSIRTQAKDAKRAGNFALLEGVIGAASAGAKIASDWAQEKRSNG